MAMMQKRNPQTQEEGFHWLRQHASEHIRELIEEFGKEQDLGLRCWLLELIGSAKSPDALDSLAQQFRQAPLRTFESPEETEVFRSALDDAGVPPSVRRLPT
jgi:hypothetical protein